MAVEVDAGCRSVDGLKRCLQDALPEVDVEAVRLEVCGRPVDDEAVLGLVGGSVIDVSASQAALAAATLREEGRAVDFEGFCNAADATDVRRCKLYLEVGLVWPPEADNPLHVAVKRGCRELCELFLASGCDKDAKDYYGDTPLHLAIHRQNLQLAQLLLESGCVKEAKDRDGNTPLHHAVFLDNLQLAKFLLASGCAKDVKNYAGDTPLHRATYMDTRQLCKLLLESGCAKDVQDNDGVTPLCIALSMGNMELAQLLFDSGCAADDEEKSLSTSSCRAKLSGGVLHTVLSARVRAETPDVEDGLP